MLVGSQAEITRHREAVGDASAGVDQLDRPELLLGLQDVGLGDQDRLHLAGPERPDHVLRRHWLPGHGTRAHAIVLQDLLGECLVPTGGFMIGACPGGGCHPGQGE